MDTTLYKHVKHILLAISISMVLQIQEITARTCNHIEVDDSDYIRNLNGYYLKNLNCQQTEGPGAPVYTKYSTDDSGEDDTNSDSEEHLPYSEVYLYYYYQGSWSGWVFSSTPCTGEQKDVFARKQSNTDSPEKVEGDWQIRNDKGSWKYDDLDLSCEDDTSHGLALLLALLCTGCVLLLALLPVLWMYVAKKKRGSSSSQTHHRQVQGHHNRNATTPATIPIPPPYSEEPPIYTIHPETTGAAALPSYVHDMTHITHKRKDLAVPPPPLYSAPPPSYDQISPSSSANKENADNHHAEDIEMTEIDNHTYGIENTSASAPGIYEDVQTYDNAQGQVHSGRTRSTNRKTTQT